MLPRELFDCVPSELDTEIKLASVNAAARAKGHHHQMKVIDWGLYLYLTIVLLYVIYIYVLFGVLRCLMIEFLTPVI